MKRILFAAAALAMFAAAPASAQIWAGADPTGVGVQVGPFAAGVGPGYWGYHEPYYYHHAYGPCRAVRERIVTRHGNVIYRVHRVCE